MAELKIRGIGECLVPDGAPSKARASGDGGRCRHWPPAVLITRSLPCAATHGGQLCCFWRFSSAFGCLRRLRCLARVMPAHYINPAPALPWLSSCVVAHSFPPHPVQPRLEFAPYILHRISFNTLQRENTALLPSPCVLLFYRRLAGSSSCSPPSAFSLPARSPPLPSPFPSSTMASPSALH
jgi:hypothetical protein